MYKQKATNILTKYRLPIKSDLISRGKQCRSNNDSPRNKLGENHLGRIKFRISNFIVCCFFVVVFFCRDSNMISIGKVEFRYYVVIILLVNVGKP